jgi:hypothetical protein
VFDKETTLVGAAIDRFRYSQSTAFIGSLTHTNATRHQLALPIFSIAAPLL